MNSEEKGLLAEYETLREEIIDGKRRRIQTMSFTIGAFGVILSIIASAVLGADIVLVETKFAIAVGGGIGLYGIAIPGLIMILSLQQSIQRVGEYIRVYIEPNVPGLNWQNRWHSFKSQSHLSQGLKGISSIYYFLSLLPLFLPIYTITQHPKNWGLIFLLIPFTGWALYLSYDMRAAVSKGWNLLWEVDINKD